MSRPLARLRQWCCEARRHSRRRGQFIPTWPVGQGRCSPAARMRPDILLRVLLRPSLAAWRMRDAGGRSPSVCRLVNASGLREADSPRYRRHDYIQSAHQPLERHAEAVSVPPSPNGETTSRDNSGHMAAIRMRDPGRKEFRFEHGRAGVGCDQSGRGQDGADRVSAKPLISTRPSA